MIDSKRSRMTVAGSRAAGRSRGAVLICVLVCVGIVSTIMLTSLASALRVRRQTRSDLQLEQTIWLAEAAIIRGLVEAESRNDYRGEIWRVDGAFANYAVAEAEISVRPPTEERQVLRISATAQLRGLDATAQLTRRTVSHEFPVASND